MRIFVTGGSGFIGNHIVNGLLEKGHKLVCLAHSRKIDKEGVESVKGDIRDKESLKIMKGCDAVIANASIYMRDPPKAIRDQMYDINVNGTKNTLELAIQYDIPKIVFTSSIVAIGDTTDIGIASEEDVAKHNGKYASLYAKTKHDCHLFAQKLIDEQDAPITMPMPGGVFGENDHSAVGDSIRHLVRKNLIAVPNVNNKVNYIHVEDVANGIILCLEKGKPEPYLIVGPKENLLNTSGFLNKIAKIGDLELPKMTMGKGMLSIMTPLYRLRKLLTGKKQVLDKELFNAMKVKYEAKNDKAVNELGFSPKPLDERLEQTIKWYIKKYRRN